MARKSEQGGGIGETSPGMYFHGFSGKPLSEIEFVGDPEQSIGDTFAISVVVELTGVNIEKIKDGTRHVLKLRVKETAPLHLVAKASEAKVDPNQTTIDEELGDYAEPGYTEDPDAEESEA
jgi:hypothetical protein